MGRMKIAVLVSGRGSNMQAILRAAEDPSYPAEIALVISNVADAPGLDIARDAGVKAVAIPHREFSDRESFDQKMTDEIVASGCDLVVLAGFMRLLSAQFCEYWRDKLINIHPSLLPAFKGLDVHARMIESGVRFGGCTVHFVRPEMDTGPIIVQAAVPIHPNDSADDLAARILKEEHQIYPQAVKWIAEGRVRISGERVVISDTQGNQSSIINVIDRQ